MDENSISELESALSDAVNHAMQLPLEDPIATIVEQLLRGQRLRSLATESTLLPSSDLVKPGSQPPEATVLVTMDPGQDLDDEMLIVLLSALRRSANVRCVGVVATLAPAIMRAQLARGTLDELGMREVPVAAGTDGGASGRTEFEGLDYLRPPRSAHLYSAPHCCTSYLYLVKAPPLHRTSILHRCGLDGEQLMSEVLTAADERSLTIVVVSSLKDVAELLKREETLFVRKVKEVVIQGGVNPFDEAQPGALLEPDTAHNNEFDHEALARVEHGCPR